MSETQTTLLPLPWEWRGEDNDLVSVEAYEKWVQGGHQQKDWPHSVLYGQWHNDQTAGVEIDEAHRHFIKLACNMHTDLVDVLQRLLESKVYADCEGFVSVASDQDTEHDELVAEACSLIAKGRQAVTPEPPPDSPQQS